MRDLNEIIDGTIHVLEDMKRAGVTHVEVAKETLEELGKGAASNACGGRASRR